jgi:hypothetical protein
VRTRLMMGTGELKASGAADATMEGEFSYNVADWKPQVNYDISGDTGELSVARGVDLTGDYAQGFDASIEGGVGEATVLVPSGACR